MINKINIHVLIAKCTDRMRTDGYSEKTIERYRCTWRNGILSYMKELGTEDFSNEIGEDFRSTIGGDVSLVTIRKNHRCISMLQDFLQTGKFLRKSKHVNPPLDGEIGKVAQLFLDSLKECRCRESTLRDKRYLLSQFIIGLHLKGIHKVCDITVDSIISAMDYSETSKIARFYTLRQFCTFLYEEGYLPINIGFVLEKNHFHQEKLPSIYTEDEINLMAKSIDRSTTIGMRDYAIFMIASRLALRASDIAALTWDAFDWDKNKLSLCQLKTGVIVDLPLPQDVGEALVTYTQYARKKSFSKEVFLSAIGPYKPMSTDAVKASISKIIRSSGVKIGNRKFGAHSLRHSLASNLLKKGTPISTISSILGHESSQATMVYIGVDVESLKQCILDAPPVDEEFYMQGGGVYENA